MQIYVGYLKINKNYFSNKFLIKSVTVSPRIESDVLLRIFNEILGDAEYSKVERSGNVEILVIAGSKYYLRIKDSIGFILISFYDGNSQKIDIARVGFGTGMLGAGDKDKERIID